MGLGNLTPIVTVVLVLVMTGNMTHSVKYRVTTCLENLEMSGNLLKIREMSGEKILSVKKVA